MQNFKFYILHSTFYFFLALSFLFLSCTSSTKPETGSLSGMVELVNDTGDPSHDPVDFAGVTVALYELSVLDTTLVRINQEYPQIGVQINQETEFDHRTQSPVYNTITDAVGRFDFTKIAVGSYNMVVKKPGWGLKYILNLNVHSGMNDISNYPASINDGKPYVDPKQEYSLKAKGVLRLFPEITLSNTIQNEFIFSSFHTYRITGNLSVLAPATFQDGVFIIVDPGNRIDFHSGLTCANTENYWWITSSFGIYEDLGVPDVSEERFSRISVSGDTYVTISKGKISYMQDGIVVNSADSSLRDLVCREGGIALVSNADALTLSDCLFSNFTDRTINIIGDASVSQSVFYKNHDNLIITDAICEVADNYFCDNWLGIRPIYGTINIHNNEFSGNRWAISTVASSPLIQLNNFYESIRYCIQTQINYVQGYSDYSNPIVHSNNFFKTSGIVFSLKPDAHEGYYNSGWVGVSTDIDAKNNYWKAASVAEVILDTLDSNHIDFAVLYVPRLNNRVPSAGIR